MIRQRDEKRLAYPRCYSRNWSFLSSKDQEAAARRSRQAVHLPRWLSPNLCRLGRRVGLAPWLIQRRGRVPSHCPTQFPSRWEADRRTLASAISSRWVVYLAEQRPPIRPCRLLQRSARVRSSVQPTRVRRCHRRARPVADRHPWRCRLHRAVHLHADRPESRDRLDSLR